MKYCEEYAALLSAFADGELTESRQAEVLSHLESCEGCREYLAQILEMKEELSCEVPELPENFAAQVMWRVRSEKTKSKKKNRRVMTAVASAAACLVLALALPQVLNGMGVTMGDAAESGTVMDGFLAGSGAESDPAADGGMPESAEDNVTNDMMSADQATGAEKEKYPSVTVEQALMEEWLAADGAFAALRAENAEGETEYYLEAAEYEDFRLFMEEQGISVPELDESEFLVVYVR